VPRESRILRKILQCAAHLTGVSWQKKSHYKYFHNPDANYKPFYKMLVPATKCPSVALGEIVQRKLMQWLKDRNESRAAEWFKKYWTGDRGHYMLAHSEIGGTNNNNGTESRWQAMQKAVCGNSGSTARLSVATIIPSLLRYLTNISREQASYWARDTKLRIEADKPSPGAQPVVSTAKYTFPSIPGPEREEWCLIELMHPQILSCRLLCIPALRNCTNIKIQR